MGFIRIEQEELIRLTNSLSTLNALVKEVYEMTARQTKTINEQQKIIADQKVDITDARADAIHLEVELIEWKDKYDEL